MEQMEHVGRVAVLKDGFATVQFTRSKMCKHCGACIYLGDSEAQVDIKNTLGAAAGDFVRVELQAKSFLQANLLAYVLPLIALIAGVLLGTRWSDWLGIVLGLAGAGAVYLLLRALEPRFKKSQRFNPVMVDILPPDYEDKLVERMKSDVI